MKGRKIKPHTPRQSQKAQGAGEERLSRAGLGARTTSNMFGEKVGKMGEVRVR